MSLQTNPFLHLIDEVARLQGRLKTLFARFHHSSGLTKIEQLVLTAVHESPAPPTVSQMGRSLGYPRQAIQRAANDLIAAGLIEREPNLHHKRAPVLVATVKGRELKSQSDAIALQIADAFLKRGDAGKCQQLAGDMQELRKAIEAYLRSQDAP